jgi:hypothetical protein
MHSACSIIDPACMVYAVLLTPHAPCMQCQWPCMQLSMWCLWHCMHHESSLHALRHFFAYHHRLHMIFTCQSCSKFLLCMQCPQHHMHLCIRCQWHHMHHAPSVIYLIQFGSIHLSSIESNYIILSQIKSNWVKPSKIESNWVRLNKIS